MTRGSYMKAFPAEIFLAFTIICFIVFGISPTDAQAHRPGELKLHYNGNSQILSATITHSVSNPEKHYVDTVTIWLNGVVVKTSEYSSQPDKLTFTYEYSVPAQDGDELKVKAECSYFGSRTQTLIPGQKQ
jgi:hypothetical protein